MTCSIVCRMWRRAIQYSLGRKLSVTVYENELTSLVNDIPQFSARVSHIQVKESNVEMDRGKTSLNLLDILLISRCLRAIIEIEQIKIKAIRSI